MHRRERVETRLAIRFGGAPIPSDQTALLQSHQRRIERAHIKVQRAAGHLLEARGNGVAVQRPRANPASEGPSSRVCPAERQLCIGALY